MPQDFANLAPTPDAVGQGKSQIDALVMQLLQRAKAPQPGGMPAPTPRYSPESMQQQGYRTQTFQSPAGDPGKGAKMADVGEAIGNIGTFIHNAVAQHKSNQVRDALAEWQGLDQALEKAQVLAGDPSAPDYKQKVQQFLSQDPFVKANLDPSNPKAVKRLKNMYKALNVDLLAGDKENVHREGLKRMFDVKKAFDKVRGAKGKMDEQKKKPQLTPDQQKQAFSEAIQRLAGKGTLQAPDPKQTLETARVMTDAMSKAADKYQIMPDAQGNILAIDKTHPERPAIQVKGTDNKPVTGADKGRKGPMLVDGVPVGIYRNGKALTPASPEWTAQDAAEMAQYKAAYATSEASKNARVDRWAKSREAAYLQSRMYPAVDAEGNTYYVSGADIKANPKKYAPASMGERIQRANAIIGPEGEISATKALLMEAIDKVGDEAFTPEARAKIGYVLKSPDPQGSWTQFLQGDVASTLTDAQQDYVAALVSMQESALSLRTVAGMGQGSEDLRNAIRKMLPGAGTPTHRFAMQQMKLFDAEQTALAKGILKIGASKDNVIKKGMAIPSPD